MVKALARAFRWWKELDTGLHARVGAMDREKRSPDWIGAGEKFALIGLSVQLDPALDRLDLPGGLTVLPNAAFELPDHWREWLGTGRVDDIKRCNLYLLAKMPSRAPSVLDDENQLLQRRVGDFFMGLMLVSKFTAHEDPFMAMGARISDEIDVRSFGVLDRPAGSIVADYTPISADRLREAARIGASLEAFKGPWQPSHWRLLRCLGIYQTTRPNRDMLDRIHQFTRCIEGLIAPKKRETTPQFKHRTELFVGPRHHPLMGELYEVRSHIEHLHEYRYLARFDRATRIRLAELEAVSEWIARSCLARILLDPDLIAQFGSATALDQFWAKGEADRRAIWGDPVDPLAPLDGFRFDHVSDEVLGAR